METKLGEFKVINFEEYNPTPVKLSKSILNEINELKYPVIGMVTGIYSKLDVTSRNGVFYSKKFWNEILNRKDIQDRLKEGKMLGTFQHPHIKKTLNSAGVPTVRHPLYSSFVTKELWIEDNLLKGKSYILNNEMGKLMATYLLAKDDKNNPLIELHVSVRGFSMKNHKDEKGRQIVLSNDYFLDAFDLIVSSPGIEGAKVSIEEFEEYEKLKDLTCEVGDKKCKQLHADKLLKKLIDNYRIK